MTDRQRERLVRDRLAARMHQRQAALLRRSLSLTRRLRRLYAEAAGRMATRAAKDGPAGIGDFERTIDGELRGVASELRRELAGIAVEAYRLTRKAMMDSVPLWWLVAYARRRVLPVREREDGEAAAEMQMLADLDRALELPPAEARALVQSLLFPPPSQAAVDAMLSAPGPGGIPWDDRLKHWERGTRDAMRRELSAGVGAGEDVAGLEKRLRPLADGMSYKAQRIARTEAARLGHRANEAVYDVMGDAVEAKILSAVMDEFTRPEHAVRNGRRFVRGADGIYRDEAGAVLPDLPDQPNCRCGIVPDLGMPDYIRKDPGARAAYESATGDLVPDPASYADWWQQAGEKERMTAVGVRRYRAAARALGRKPEWPDFLDPEGKLLPVERIRLDGPERREQRLRQVTAMLTQRKLLFQQAAALGYRKPMTHVTHPERAVAAGEPGGYQQLRRRFEDAMEKSLTLTDREQARRRQWEESGHTGREVRGEFARRLDDHRRRMDEVEALRREADASALLPAQRRELLERSREWSKASRRDAQSALVLLRGERTEIELRLSGSLDATSAASAREAAAYLEGVVSRRAVDPAFLSRVDVRPVESDSNAERREKYGGRGYYAEGKVWLPEDCKPGRAAHEIVHHLEAHSGVRERYSAWFSEATRGATPTPLGEGYHEDERYLPRTDGGAWATNYTGKIHESTMEPVEIATMCVQRLFEDAERFMRTDPALFELTIDAMRGN